MNVNIIQMNEYFQLLAPILSNGILVYIYIE